MDHVVRRCWGSSLDPLRDMMAWLPHTRGCLLEPPRVHGQARP